MTLSHSNPQTSTGLYYQHSGKFTPTGVVMALTAGLITAIVAAFIYSYLVLYVPFIYLNMLASAGFGGIMGAATAWAAKLGKVRSASLTFLLAFIVAVVGFWFAWAVWVNGVIDRFIPGAENVSLVDFVTNPALLWEWVGFINKAGTWTPTKSSKEPLNGAGLTVIWIIEAGIIFVMAFVGAAIFAKSEMFCESCGQWCGKSTTLGTTGAGDEKEAKPRLEAHDLRYLETLPPQSDPLHSWSIQTEICPTCQTLNALTISSHKTTVNKKGESTNVNTPVVQRLLLSNDEVVYLTTMMAMRLAPPQSPPPPPPPADETRDQESEEE